MKTITLVALISLLASHFAFGQQPTDSFHTMLARSTGTWTGQATMTFAPDAPPITSTSSLTNTMAMGGLYQVSDIHYNMMGKTLTGIRVTGYDTTKKIFTRAMIQDGGNGVAMEGPWDEATRSMTMRYKQFDSAGRENEMKEVYTIVDENTEVLEIYRIDAPTKKETKILNVKWTRDK